MTDRDSGYASRHTNVDKMLLLAHTVMIDNPLPREGKPHPLSPGSAAINS